MAGEEDVELRDLVAQSLEAKGVLGKIRAQLRASVFLALEEQETQQGRHPLVNEKLQKYLRTKEGQLATGLVREFLEFFELEFTCAVFDPESNALESYPGREQLAKDVGLDPNTVASGAPILTTVLQRATSQAQSLTTQHLHFPEPPPPPIITTSASSSGATFTSLSQAPFLPPSSITTTAGEDFPPTTHAATTTTVSSAASVSASQSQPAATCTSGSESSARGPAGPKVFDSKLNSNESSRLRPSNQPTTNKGLSGGLAPDGRRSGDAGKWPSLGPGGVLDGSVPGAYTEPCETFPDSSEAVEKLLGEGEESGRDELDDFFDSSHPPSGLDFLSKGMGKAASHLRSTRDGGVAPGDRASGSLSSLRDAPSLPGTSMPGAPSLRPAEGWGALGIGFDSTIGKLLATDGEYEDDFHSGEGGSVSVSEHLEDPSHPLSSGKLETTDLTLSESSLIGAGEFDYIEPVQTQS